MEEKDIDELLKFATGKGKYVWTGPYFHTYPGADENQDGLHSACVELENRGLLKRGINEPGHVSWVATSKPHIATPALKCFCQRNTCGHIWVSIGEDPPEICPKCHSRKWKEPNKVGEKRGRKKA